MVDRKSNVGDFWRFDEYTNEIQRVVNQRQTTLRFISMKAMLQAAKDIVDMYSKWETQNLIYLGDPRKTFYFDTKSGKLDFRGENKVAGYGYLVPKGLELSELIAPEIVNGTVDTYSRDTQHWTLAVVLYEFFYHNDGPYKGAESLMRVFYSADEEYRWMAKNGIFNMEDNTRRNRAVHGVQDRLDKYWWIFPEILRDIFTQIFVDGKEDCKKRIGTEKWKIVLNQVENRYLECSCGYKGFVEGFPVNEDHHYMCPKCNQTFYQFSNGLHAIYLSSNTIIKRNQIYPEFFEDDARFGIVVENTKQKGLFGVKNVSNEHWLGMYPNGLKKDVAPGGGIPIWQGLELTFAGGNKWVIKEVQKND